MPTFSFNNLQRKRFLLEFTRELIKNSSRQQRILKVQKPEQRGVVIPKMPVIKTPMRIVLPKSRQVENIRGVVSKLAAEKYELSLRTVEPPLKGKLKPLPVHATRLMIPEERLPPRFQYLRPVPDEKEIDLGKINPLVKDPMVAVIDCPGPNQQIVVTGTMGTKKTNFVLSREEIDDIVEKFSREAKIPIQEGIFRVVVGRFIFLAIISEIIGSRFTIKKMIYSSSMRREVNSTSQVIRR